MIRVGASIANFVSTYFDFLSDIVRVINRDSGGDNFIPSELLEEMAIRYEVPIENLLKLRVARMVDDVYIFDKRVVTFVAFCNNEFALSSPESVKKHHFTLDELYNRFIRNNGINDLIDCSNAIIDELNDLIIKLDGTIQRLLDDTLKFKKQRDEKSPKERFDMASRLIDEYAKPLKEIVRDRDDSILPLIRKIKSISFQKRANSYDRNIESKMQHLWVQCDITHKHIESFARKIISEIYTLRKIQKNSLILSSAIEWLQNIDRVEDSNLSCYYRKTLHSNEFVFEAIEEFEIYFRSNQELKIPDSDEIRRALEKNSDKYFEFNERDFIDRVTHTGRVESFFKWVYEELKRDGILSFQNYCRAISISNSLDIRYKSEREVIIFDEFDLNIPIAVAKPKESKRLER